MKKIFISLLLTVVFYAMASAQSDSDTDPNRWERVKSWTGTFTFSCTAQDNATEVAPDGTIITSIDIDDVNGDCTLNQHVTPPSGAYGWQGNGMGAGIVSDFLETKDDSGTCSTERKTGDLAPIVAINGSLLEWYRQGPNSGKYIFMSGEISLPVTLTPACNGTTFPSTQEQWDLGGIGTLGYRTLPASGYHLTGDAEMIFNGFNNGHFHWDLQPAEFYPVTTTTTTTPSGPCAAEAIYGENSEQTELLRKYRDNVLSKTPAGQEIIKTYYKFSPTVTRLLEQRPLLKNKARIVIDSMLPGIKKKVGESSREQ